MGKQIQRGAEEMAGVKRSYLVNPEKASIALSSAY